MLGAEGEELLYIATHGPFEKGKDVITRARDGSLRAYQLKSGNDLPPNSHPFITEDSRLRFGAEIVSSPPGLCGCGKRGAVSTSA